MPTRELADERPRPGETFAGRYVIEAKLGEGGFGAVYAARDGQLERDVAIKVLADSGDAVALARFLQEAKTIAALDSEHVITVHEVALAGRAPYLVMERLRGSDLAELLKSGALPIATAVDHVVQAALGVAHAHGKGIVHRDLKPRNLFLAERADGTQLIKVLDFGVAKAAASELTETGAAVGTTRYMAPEQLKSSRTVDARTDIWALGAVLYELIAGVPAFAGKSAGEVGVAVLTEPHRPLRELVADVPAELSAVIDRCLAKDPEARFPDVAALVRALGADASRVSRVTRALAATPGRHGIATRKDSDARRDARTVTTSRPEPPAPPPRRGLLIGCVLGLGGIAFGIAMAMRSPRVERVVVLADAAPVLAPDAAVVVADAPVVEDAAVVVAVDAAPRPPPRPAKPRPPQPTAEEVARIAKACNLQRSAAPSFLRPGEAGGAYGCRQLGLLGCAGIERDCGKYAVTDAEKLTCRNFILRIKRDGCP